MDTFIYGSLNRKIEESKSTSKEQIYEVVNEYLSENQSVATQEDVQKIYENSDDIASLKSDIADVNNIAETPAAAGKVWTSTDSGAGWYDSTGGKAGAFELLVSQELAETVNAVSFEFGKTVNEIYMLYQSPKVTALSACPWE